MKAVKEIPQEIDVEMSTDEDVDEMILETEVGGDFKQLFPWSESQNEPESDAVTDRHGVPPEDVRTVTVEVARPKIKTVVKCMEDGGFYSHGRLVLKEMGGVCCLRNSSGVLSQCSEV